MYAKKQEQGQKPCRCEKCGSNPENYLQVHHIPEPTHFSGCIFLHCIYCGTQEKREITTALVEIARNQVIKPHWPQKKRIAVIVK